MLIKTDNLQYCQDALALKKNIEVDFLSLGEYLYNIKEHNLFDPQWGSFLEFCDELKMSQNTVNKLIQIHETFILGYGFSVDQISTVGGWGALQEILPMVKSKKDAVRWLKEASLLTSSDLRKNIREEKTGVDMARCRHKDSYIIRICRTCGDRMQLDEK